MPVACVTLWSVRGSRICGPDYAAVTREIAGRDLGAGVAARADFMSGLQGRSGREFRACRVVGVFLAGEQDER
jgi:hypothetical protein